MLDKWLEEDIRQIFEIKDFDRVVIVDPSNDIPHVLQEISGKLGAEFFSVNDDISELRAKFEIEKNLSGRKVIIHSSRTLVDMKFCREYSATGDCISENIARYIRNKLGFNLELSDEEIIAAGRNSIGKGQKYWKKISADGDEAIFVEDDLLDFLQDPVAFEKKNKASMEVFLDQMSKYSIHDTTGKPIKTVAQEMANSILSVIINKNCDEHFSSIYSDWLKNRTYEKSLKDYVEHFSEELVDLSFENMNIDHPFKKLDEKCLNFILEKYLEVKIDKEIKKYVSKRQKSVSAQIFEIKWWADVNVLLFEELPDITRIESLDDLINEYQKTLWKLDASFRHLYSTFINDRQLTDKLQSIYRKKMDPYVKRWFEYFKDQYKQNQSDLIKNILKCDGRNIAVIVGDAISLSIANEICSKIDSSMKELECSLDVICSDYPSETANNMSALFSSGDAVLDKREEREKKLRETLGCEVSFQELEKFCGMSITDSHLILYSADIDNLGHEGQTFLKYFDKYIETIPDKISLLLKNNYSEVHLVSDHGFIIYGNLSDADKTEITFPGINETKERYILSKDKIAIQQSGLNFVTKPDGRYVYYKESFSPFKTRGEYGFAHGGMTPQELLIPHLICRLKESSNDIKLKVMISNKNQLKKLTGESVVIKIKAEVNGKGRRKVEIQLKDNKNLNVKSDVITLEPDQQIEREFNVKEFDFKINVLDVSTKETLDTINIKKQSSRDLGGLL